MKNNIQLCFLYNYTLHGTEQCADDGYKHCLLSYPDQDAATSVFHVMVKWAGLRFSLQWLRQRVI